MEEFFNFTEAPDFSGLLGERYKGVNVSFDRAEELERENDKVREKNAELPFKITKELIDLSPTIAKTFEGINDARRERLLGKGYDGIGEDDLVEDRNTLNGIFDFGKAEGYVKNQALQNDDNVTYGTLDTSGANTTRRRLLILEKIKERSKTEFLPWVAKNYPAGFDNVTEYRQAFEKYKSTVLANTDRAGFNLRFVKGQMKETFNGLESSFYETQNKNLTAKNVLKEQSRMIDEVTNALNSENPQAAFLETSEYNLGFFNGNRGKAQRAFINVGLLGMKKGTINIDKFESVLFGEVTAKGDKTKILIDKLGGGPENTLWAESVLNEIENAKKGVFENKALSRGNYAKKFVEDIQKIEDGQETRMTKLEYAQYVSTNWDIKQGGSNLPEIVKNRLSKESGDDILIKAQLDYKLNKGIPITKEEVLKLSDPFVESQYLPKVADGGNPLAPTEDFKKLAYNQFKGYATKHAKQEGVAPGRESTQWTNIMENAEREYPVLFAKHMQTADSAVDAHILALGDIQKKTNAGVYDNLVANRSKNKQRNIDLIKAEEHIKTIDPNIINTGLIYGSEEVIKEAAELHKNGQTHLFYEQLANKIPGVTGEEIQYKQVEIFNKMNKLDKPIKSDLLLAYEKLDPTVQFYLSHHPSPAKVARAKIEAFKDDAQIDYDEIDFLLPAAKSVIESTLRKEGATNILRNLSSQEFSELDKETQEKLMPTAQWGKGPDAPVEGSWQKIKGSTGYYVYENGEWIRKGQRNKNSLKWNGIVGEYRDIDNYVKPTENAVLGKIKPALGTWKKISGSLGYAVWDGKEWVRSGNKGTGGEYEGSIETYKDLDDTIKQFK